MLVGNEARGTRNVERGYGGRWRKWLEGVASLSEDEVA